MKEKLIDIVNAIDSCAKARKGTGVNPAARVHCLFDRKEETFWFCGNYISANDLKDLEDRFDKTTQSVDDLEKSFKKFKKSSKAFQKETEEKLEEIDKRIKSLEDN